ncbi:MAG TPA: DsbC family protein [Parasulfuritortus sp.]
MRIFISLLLTLLFTTACNAAQDGNIKKNLEARFPGLHVNSVSKSPVDGLYEVVVEGDHIIYVDKDAKYLLDGILVETATKRNLTQEKVDKLTAVNFDSLPLQQAIKIVHGDGSRRLAVFSDPDCPFCRKLEPELAQLKNVTIYIFEYPLPMHTDAARKARVIWCSPDRAKAWDDFMLRGKLADNKGDCPNPIDANLALGQKLNVQGTPNIVLPNGQRIPGLVPADRLAKMLDAASGK